MSGARVRWRGRVLDKATPGDGAVPEALERVALKDEGGDRARAAHAWQNVIDLGKDFRSGGGDDDATYPTRLGEPVQTLALMEGGAPLGGDWAMAEVSARVSRLRDLALPDQAAPEMAAVKAGWPEWKRAAVTVCPVVDDVSCLGLAYDRDLGLVFR